MASTGWMYSSPASARAGDEEPDTARHLDGGRSTKSRGCPKSMRRTAGINGTMVDIIKAVMGQGVPILSVVDAIETINFDHTMSTAAERVPEGYVFASLDVLALDVLCARYMFNNVPMAEARRLVERGESAVGVGAARAAAGCRRARTS